MNERWKEGLPKAIHAHSVEPFLRPPSTNCGYYGADTRLIASGGTQSLPIRFCCMKLIGADESRAQAKHCRELAMSTKDAEIELLFLQTAEDLERQADRLEKSHFG